MNKKNTKNNKKNTKKKEQQMRGRFFRVLEILELWIAFPFIGVGLAGIQYLLNKLISINQDVPWEHLDLLAYFVLLSVGTFITWLVLMFVEYFKNPSRQKTYYRSRVLVRIKGIFLPVKKVSKSKTIFDFLKGVGFSLIPILILFLIHVFQSYISITDKGIAEVINSIPKEKLTLVVSIFLILIGIIYSYFKRLPKEDQDRIKKFISSYRFVVPGTFLFTASGFIISITGQDQIEKTGSDFINLLAKQKYHLSQPYNNEINTFAGDKLFKVFGFKGNYLKIQDPQIWNENQGRHIFAYVFDTASEETAKQVCRFLSRENDYVGQSWSILRENGYHYIVSGQIEKNYDEFITSLLPKDKFFSAQEPKITNRVTKLKMAVHWVDADVTNDDLDNCQNYKNYEAPNESGDGGDASDGDAANEAGDTSGTAAK